MVHNDTERLKVAIMGCGFIGHHLARKFLDEDYDVFIFNRSQLSENRISHISGSKNGAAITTTINLVYRDIYDYLPNDLDIMIHTAAKPQVSFAVNNPQEASRAIVDSTTFCLDYLKDFKPKNKFKSARFVYLSSSMVYGDFHGLKPRENDPLDPQEPYGILKEAAERLVRFYSKQYEYDYTIIRPSAVYGPRDKERVITKMANAVIENGIFECRGNPRLDFTYIDDLVEGIYLATTSKNGANETFNITRGKAESLILIADYLLSLYPESKAKLYHMPSNTLYPERGALDISKAESLLGYKPKYDYKKGIKKMIESDTGK